MSQVGLKACWTVTAEVIPGQAIMELTKVWEYTSHDFLQDGDTPKDQPTIFSRCVQESGEYAMSLQDPSAINVVTCKFMWM